MIDYNSGLQRIVDGQGMEMAVAGMSIVFVALALIATFIALLPNLLRLLAKVIPETDHFQPSQRPAGGNDLAMVAAAAVAYHKHAGGGS